MLIESRENPKKERFFFCIFLAENDSFQKSGLITFQVLLFGIIVPKIRGRSKEFTRYIPNTLLCFTIFTRFVQYLLDYFFYKDHYGSIVEIVLCQSVNEPFSSANAFDINLLPVIAGMEDFDDFSRIPPFWNPGLKVNIKRIQTCYLILEQEKILPNNITEKII